MRCAGTGRRANTARLSRGSTRDPQPRLPDHPKSSDRFLEALAESSGIVGEDAGSTPAQQIACEEGPINRIDQWRFPSLRGRDQKLSTSQLAMAMQAEGLQLDSRIEEGTRGPIADRS